MEDLTRAFPGTRKAEDYSDPFFRVLDAMASRAMRLPKPLAWVEPSVNMPYLQACQSYIFQSPLASILATGALLEHVLRIAVIDRFGGKQATMDRDRWESFKNWSIRDFLMQEGEKGKKAFDPVLASHIDTIIDSDDRLWWKDTAMHVRNKVAHLDIPALISEIGYREDFVGEYRDTRDPKLIYGDRRWWGAPFHSSDDMVALEFLNQATDRLDRLITKMAWEPYRVWWTSQEDEYRKFFEYEWTKKALSETIRKTEAYWHRESAAENGD